MVFRGANKQKHIFKKNPKTPIWGKPPVVVGGKLLASGYWYGLFSLLLVASVSPSLSFIVNHARNGEQCYISRTYMRFFKHYRGIARHCNYLGDLMLALSFSLPCGIR